MALLGKGALSRMSPAEMERLKQQMLLHIDQENAFQAATEFRIGRLLRGGIGYSSDTAEDQPQDKPCLGPDAEHTPGVRLLDLGD